MKNQAKYTLVFLPFLLLLLAPAVVAQNTTYTDYYTAINKAKQLAAEQQNKRATQAYNSAFETAFPFPDDIIDAIKLNGKLNNKAEVEQLLKLLVLSGYKKDNEIAVYLEEDQQYFKHRRDTYLAIPEYQDELDTIYPLHRQAYLKNVDFAKDQYLSMFKSHEFLITYTRKYANATANQSQGEYLQNTLWSSTKDLFLNLYHAGQDISRQQTDTWNDDLFLNCLIHSAQTPTYKKEEYQTFLFDMVKLGNLSPYQYATIIDDVERRLGNPQRYGTITDPVAFDGNIEKYRNTPKQISSIQDIKKVDERRKAIFLPPLWVSAKKFGFKLPEDYTF
ncbi:hypothetical protein NWE55_02140 [Myroides albus]|uniref:hypothetical protein n=1 Tax=Myroides albus TaxID=2562892 RepID=UPI002158F6A0|nr:hypothetical protein [Myroides albus]UVD80114.1 hypothetical protein NWE55_02140 [Myroides albus]